MTTFSREYARLRAKGWRATDARRSAKTVVAWKEAESKGLVRLAIKPDDVSDIKDLEGDLFNPQANSEIHPAKLEQDRQKYIDQINREGVWGIVGEYFDGEEWQHGDSVWGFVGDDWKDSGYDTDVMQQTLDALASLERCPACGRPKLK